VAQQKKICLIGPTHPFRGGISHYTTLLYRHLKKHHEIRFFSFTRQYPQWLFPGKTDIDPSRDHISEPGVYKLLDSMNPATWLKTVYKIVRFKPDLLIIPWWVSFWAPQFWTICVLVKALTGTNILFLCHNVVAHESKKPDKWLTKQVLNQGDFFIVHSEEDKRNLKKILPDAVVRKTFHPTYDVFNTGTCDGRGIKSKFGISGKILLFFGFVREYKGLKYLLRAMPGILEDLDVTLFIVGEFWKDKDQYMDLISSLGIKDNVIIVDEYVPNEAVGNYFSAADLVVQPYVSATGSGVVQTAFGFARPVVATKVGCLPEVIAHEKTGFLVAPANSQKIVDSVKQYFTRTDVDAMRQNIIRENEKFSWRYLVKVIEDF